MDAKALETLLASRLPPEIAKELVSDFLQIRYDVSTQTLGRSAPGKFVESVVQALQYIEQGSFDKQPRVDEFLKNVESRASTLSEGLKFCAARIARAMYTLRNKRNILHKGDVDPNEYDLRFLISGAQWILAEFVREISGSSMQGAGAMIAQIQAPVGALIEDFGDRRIVHGELSTKDEILVLLHSHYPNAVPLVKISSSLDRREASGIRKVARELWRTKRIEGTASAGYQLTIVGIKDAMNILKAAA